MFIYYLLRDFQKMVTIASLDAPEMHEDDDLHKFQVILRICAADVKFTNWTGLSVTMTILH